MLGADANFALVLGNLGKELATIRQRMETIEALPAETREEAIEIAREILERLKLLAENPDQNELLRTEQEAFIANQAQAELLKELAGIFHQQLQAAKGAAPELLQDGRVIEATDAVGTAAYMVTMQAGIGYQRAGMNQEAEETAAQIARMPASWRNPRGKSFKDLIREIESALELIMKRIEAAQSAQGALNPAQQDVSGRARIKPGASLNPNQRQNRQQRTMRENIEIQMDDQYIQMQMQKQQQQHDQNTQHLDITFKAGATIRGATMGAAANAAMNKSMESSKEKENKEKKETQQPGQQQQQGQPKGTSVAANAQSSNQKASAETAMAEERLRQLRQRRQQQQQQKARDQKQKSTTQNRQQNQQRANQSIDYQTAHAHDHDNQKHPTSPAMPKVGGASPSLGKSGVSPMEALVKQANINLSGLSGAHHADIGSLKPSVDKSLKPPTDPNKQR